jgi:Protein of unknown function (DUF2855)
MQALTIDRLLTNKSVPGQTRADTLSVSFSCAQGDVVLKIRHVAITANNITYAAFGDAMQYWQFFPTGIEGWGHMPVWGFADVTHSETPGIEVGERFYGYFPIASHLVVKPARITARGFFDYSEHRQALVSAYNQYSRCSEDEAYGPDMEYYQSLLRPLFITSYTLADYLADHDFFNSRRLIISSASSKTAYGTAYCLKRDYPAIELAGLTSSGNVDFVKRLGCYDTVSAYGNIAGTGKSLPGVYVDFAGSNTLRAEVHHHYADHLRHDCFVGATQNTAFVPDDALPGPKPEFFFAPNQIKKRNQELGGAEFTRRFNLAQKAFINRVSDPKNPWISLHTIKGFARTATLIDALYAGLVDPQQGNIVVLETP